MSKKCVARIGGRGELSILGELIETPLCQRYYNQESWSKGLHDGTVARGGALQLLGDREPGSWISVPFDLKQITNASGSLIKFESSHPSTKVYTTVGEGKDLIADGIPEDIDNWPDLYQAPPDDPTIVKSIVSDPTSPSGTAMRVDFSKEPTAMLGTIGCEIDPLEEGKTYTWSIWLKASRDTLLGGLVVDLVLWMSLWFVVSAVALTTSWKRYTHTFTSGRILSVFRSTCSYSIRQR